MTKKTVLSLFCGCGGLDLGFKLAGFEIVGAYDHWDMAIECYNHNRDLLGHEGKVLDLDTSNASYKSSDLPDADVIIGGPPCQGFSFAGKQIIEDERNKLYLSFVQIVKDKRPLAFVMENVRGMESMALDDIKKSFNGIGYDINVTRAKAINFGVPQKRERILIVGFRTDLNLSFSTPEENYGGFFAPVSTFSILEAIGDLSEPPFIKKGINRSNGAIEKCDIPNHYCIRLPESVEHFVRHIPNGGCFRDAPRGTLPERLVKILDNPKKYRSPRLFPKPNPHQPAQTIPADTNASIGGVLAPDLIYTDSGCLPVNPKDNMSEAVYTSPNIPRRFTPREAARLQTFPDEYFFIGGLASQHKLIGNAVPVKMAEAYAKKILSMLTT